MSMYTSAKTDFELRNERPNDWAIIINGKFWKAFPYTGKTQESYLRQMCQRKSAQTGKVWELTPYAM